MCVCSQLITNWELSGSTSWELQPVAPTRAAALLPWPQQTRAWSGFGSVQTDAERDGGSPHPTGGSVPTASKGAAAERAGSH